MIFLLIIFSLTFADKNIAIGMMQNKLEHFSIPETLVKIVTMNGENNFFIGSSHAQPGQQGIQRLLGMKNIDVVLLNDFTKLLVVTKYIFLERQKKHRNSTFLKFFLQISTFFSVYADKFQTIGGSFSENIQCQGFRATSV